MIRYCYNCKWDETRGGYTEKELDHRGELILCPKCGMLLFEAEGKA